ncbi:ornithine cyclodeaminase family protein [uncultured Enterovirga sp.]|uniref:ornithine cyclodeaminase family protein n=1 Tax=uncultured Enterovirga sp. TaxID=2026352 RepID=UPI0035CC62A5
MRVVTAEEIDGVLLMPSLIEALDRAFRGGITAPPRHHHAVARPDGDATLLLMPAWSARGASGEFLGVKTVSVFPGNRARGLPSVQGTYLLMDGATGEPLAALDGARLTLWRTAAASALAARHLARPDAGRMLMVGAGALAPFLIRAHAAVRPLNRIAIWNRNPAPATALAARLAAEGWPAVAAGDDLAREVAGADLVSCATLSETPLVRGEWLTAGSHLDLVGAFTLGMREADDVALARASVHVDTEACTVEGGDVAVAIRAGTFDRAAIRGDLADLVTGRAPGRTSPDEITLFKSIGASLEDLAAAIEVWRSLAT